MRASAIRKLKIFISYSHACSVQRGDLSRKLTELGHQVRHDVGDDRMSDKLHKAISANINWCDVVIPIVTKEWMSSHECRDEIVRAHERRKRIIPFRKEDVTDDGPPRLPFFLRESIFTRWSDVTWDDDVDKFVRNINEISIPYWAIDPFRTIREIGDVIQNTAEVEPPCVPKWKADLCKLILDSSKDRIRSILTTENCRFDVSHENSYLTYAAPIFRNAKSIIATCIASISTFWTNPDFHPRAGDYLSTQHKSADSIIRLFVFKDPREVNTYKNILQSHYVSYGSRTDKRVRLKTKLKNAVLLCSVESYEKLLTNWEQHIDSARLREDFGILDFPDSGNRMHAVLRTDEFSYREYGEGDQSLATDRDRIVREILDRCSLIPENQKDPTTGICRWTEKWYTDNTFFAKRLGEMFERRATTIHHYVVLRGEAGTDLGPILYALAARFSEKKKDLRILTMGLDKRKHIFAIDGRYHGQLKVRDDYEYVLQLEFEDEAALQFYYGHPVHSVERETLYSALCPEAAKEFEALKDTPDVTEEQKMTTFNRIESMIISRGLLSRFDVSSNEPMSVLVQQPGVIFNGLKK